LLGTKQSLPNQSILLMLFNKIHHIAIICYDYIVSKEFYTKILGFEIINENYREDKKSFKLDLKINNSTQIELFSFENPPYRLSNPEATGLRHLAFEVDNINDTIAYLKQNCVDSEEVRIDTLTGKQFTFFRDPDNLPIEIYSI
jgi:glyoxylase I family protein